MSKYKILDQQSSNIVTCMVMDRGDVFTNRQLASD